MNEVSEKVLAKRARVRAWRAQRKEIIAAQKHNAHRRKMQYLASHPEEQSAHREKNRAYRASKRAETHEARSAYQAEYRKKNIDRLKKYQKDWAARKKSELREYHRKYREKKRKDRAKYIRDWKRLDRRTNHEKWSAMDHKERARRRGAAGKFSESDVQLILKGQRNRCAACRKKLCGRYHIDHITPLARGGSNYPRNIQITCPTCNTSKGAKDPIDFMQSRGFLL